MARVQAGFQIACERLDDPILVTAWLAKALHEIGGETRAFATKHANDLLIELLGLDQA
jgi:hypothetical protein